VLLVASLDIGLLDELQVQDTSLDFSGTLGLVKLLHDLDHRVLVEQLSKLTLLLPSLGEQVETVHNLSGQDGGDVEDKRCDHFVLHHVVEEGVWDVLLGSLFVHSLLEDCAESSPPSSKALGRLLDVTGELVEMCLELFLRWMEGYLRVVVATGHLDEEGPLIS